MNFIMKSRRIMTAFVSAMILICSTITVSAEGALPANYVNTLIASGNVNLIINVDAYRAAYSDLNAVFGDNTAAYVEHYLTAGIYEGRTQGVLFNPLAYAEAYPDIKAVLGDNVAALTDHYITCGIAENRTAGTACGYADIATAEAAISLGLTGTSANNTENNSNYVNDTTTPAVPGGNLVWIATRTNGKRYHLTPSCSNMINPTQVTLEEAINMGKTACQICY